MQKIRKISRADFGKILEDLILDPLGLKTPETCSFPKIWLFFTF